MIGQNAARLNHGHLAHADGNADWVLTIFSSLSLVSEIYFYIMLDMFIYFVLKSDDLEMLIVVAFRMVDEVIIVA